MGDPVVELARRVRDQAYAPYSGFPVGAAIESVDGRLFAGANVENASYGLTLCAERVALAAAVSAGARRFARIVVATGGSPPAAPCGACRQALAEFGSSIRVEAVGPDATRSWLLSELLPDEFGPADLPE